MKFLLFLFLLLIQTGFNQAGATEYEIKAVFLYNFTQFVEWPPSAFTNEHEPFVIGVLGEDPFGKYLDETVSGESFNTHPLLVKRFHKVEDIKECHIVFLSEPMRESLETVIQHLKGKNILTVSDVNDFIRKGGMIKFIKQNDKIKIRINLEATKAANLKISSKLLRLAEVVK